MNKYLKTSVFSIFTILLLGAFLASCSSGRSIVAGTAGESVSGTSAFDAMVNSYTGWNRIRVPFTMRLVSPADFTIGGTAVFDRGKSINMSLRMIGMEVAALQITPDSLIIVEKINRRYVVLPIAEALGGLDASVDNIQDLLTGRAFILGSDSITASMRGLFSIQESDPSASWILTPQKQPKVARYSFGVTPAGPLSSMSVESNSGNKVNLTFSGPAMIPSHGAFDSSLALSTRIKDKDLRIVIDWDFSRAKWDDNVETKPVKIGAGYRQIDIHDLIKSLPSQSR